MYLIGKLTDVNIFFSFDRLPCLEHFLRMYSKTVDSSAGVKYDQIGKLKLYYSKKHYPEKLRSIKYFDQEQQKELIFLSNNTDLSAKKIAMLYKKRWGV